MSEPIEWTQKAVPLAELAPYYKNPRKIGGKKLDDLRESVGKFGYAEPLVANVDGTLIGGHARLTVAAADGLESVPVNYPSRKLTDKEVEELNIRLNKNVAGEWDWDILMADFDAGDLESWGFDESEFPTVETIAPSEEDVPDAPSVTDELLKKWGVVKGDVWRIGEHRIICGSSTDPLVVEKLMQGEQAHMMFTDPPYGVDYGEKNAHLEKYGKSSRGGENLQNDGADIGDLDVFLRGFLTILPIRAGGSWYICAPPGATETVFRNAIESAGMQLRQCIVWAKDSLVLGRQDYHGRHESILYGWIDGAAHYFVDDRTQDTVWEFARPKASKYHPTMKPIEIPAKAIANSSKHGQTVYEPFSGSGSTMIACELTGRKCRAIELDPKYVAVCLERMSELTDDIERIEDGDGGT